MPMMLNNRKKKTIKLIRMKIDADDVEYSSDKKENPLIYWFIDNDNDEKNDDL